MTKAQTRPAPLDEAYAILREEDESIAIFINLLRGTKTLAPGDAAAEAREARAQRVEDWLKRKQKARDRLSYLIQRRQAELEGCPAPEDPCSTVTVDDEFLARIRSYIGCTHALLGAFLECIDEKDYTRSGHKTWTGQGDIIHFRDLATSLQKELAVALGRARRG
jgi:hypothetical protein